MQCFGKISQITAVKKLGQICCLKYWSNEIHIGQRPPVAVPAFFHFHKNVLQQQKVHDPPQIDPYFSLPHPP